eukprot:TRINITY_DN5328_c0_g1_i1.p1 TRINITY_DN5328_c0_g1~~TRINITY_DN5328_c0_g1_i1.p1  ORF type:complete len:350 (-),score=66.83 TRINITY_DN5328_c0_g1_i1:26-1075(-)
MGNVCCTKDSNYGIQGDEENVQLFLNNPNLPRHYIAGLREELNTINAPCQRQAHRADKLTESGRRVEKIPNYTSSKDISNKKKCGELPMEKRHCIASERHFKNMADKKKRNNCINYMYTEVVNRMDSENEGEVCEHEARNKKEKSSKVSLRSIDPEQRKFPRSKYSHIKSRYMEKITEEINEKDDNSLSHSRSFADPTKQSRCNPIKKEKKTKDKLNLKYLEQECKSGRRDKAEREAKVVQNKNQLTTFESEQALKRKLSDKIPQAAKGSFLAMQCDDPIFSDRVVRHEELTHSFAGAQNMEIEETMDQHQNVKTLACSSNTHTPKRLSLKLSDLMAKAVLLKNNQITN